MAVAFVAIFIAHIEKQLLVASPSTQTYPLKVRFIDDIFSEWTISEKEINNFVVFLDTKA